MIINKVTMGYVVQNFDTATRQFVGQEFVPFAGETEWQKFDEQGCAIKLRPYSNEDLELIYGKGGVDEPALAVELVQPN